MVYLQEWRPRFKWLPHAAIIAHIHTEHALLFHKKEIHPNMKQAKNLKPNSFKYFILAPVTAA